MTINIKKYSTVTLLFLLCSAALFSNAQTDTAAVNDIKHFQSELNREYTNPLESPLDSIQRLSFKSHEFYPIDLSYRINAKFIRTPDETVFQMKTTGTKTPEYVKFGEAYFVINGKSFVLNTYQNIQLTKREEYKNYLFLPFTDNTNGVETYGGGRYIDLVIPEKDSIIIDFNKAYNPYCAYSDKYSCPIPPKENYLNTEINAGVRYVGEH
jgi:uncharacterized protein